MFRKNPSMHNAAACCTIVCYFLLIFSWSTGISAGFTKRVPLTLATSVLNMLTAVFLALMIAIFHRKIISVNQDTKCGGSNQLLQIICQNRVVKYGYSLGMCWLGFLFTFLNSICWYHISACDKEINH
ncbi:hypothetical protein BpHYR1_050154 [Brachionus plicatilis]|uniref:Uncharacterized protein n=1 Tax=Brachionus plicatilis TaxID=10195 RepID=A0A3M7Q5S3_BRAPC|nr:hypothetical protein BpHYR1_050154 [Brachionus plicatilis]